jgi:hypothetical protein
MLTGKERIFNQRFLIMTDHIWSNPRPARLRRNGRAAGRNGQVENQVQTIRGRFVQPRLRFASLEELNGWLEASVGAGRNGRPIPNRES